MPRSIEHSRNPFETLRSNERLALTEAKTQPLSSVSVSHRARIERGTEVEQKKSVQYLGRAHTVRT